MFKATIAACLCAALAAGGAAAQTAPSPVMPNIDASLDGANPARRIGVEVPSHGEALDGRMLLAAGAGTHPTMIMLDGLPGWDSVMDVDIAARAAGWNVLVFRYRGAWGAPGVFSIQHAIEDAAAAVDWLRTPEIAARYGVDARRIVLAGHSMGGFCALAAGRNDRKLAGMIAIDPWDAGLDARMILANPQYRPGYDAALDDPAAVGGVTGHGLAQETLDHAQAWDYVDWAPGLAGRPLLVFGAGHSQIDGNGPAVTDLTKAIRGRDGHALTAFVWPSDHYFTDRRAELTGTIVTWLAGIRPVDQ